MKPNLAALLLVLAAAPPATAQCYFPIYTGSLPPSSQYDLVVVFDGYTTTCFALPQPQHVIDANAFRTQLFSVEPFATYVNYLNIHGIHRTSVQTGADHPELNPQTFANTAYNATYNNGGVVRCLLMSDTSPQNGGSLLGVTQAFIDAASTAPGFDGHVLAIVNDPTYGGCAFYGSHAGAYNGNQLPLNGAQVAVHELGHLFGLLGDEYGGAGAYGGPPPFEANLTTVFNPLKWVLWVGTGGITATPPAGGLGFNTGIYHPKTNCLMNTGTAPFCEVCREQLVKRLYVYADSFTTTTPPDAVPISLVQGQSVALSFTHRIPTAAVTIPGTWPAPAITWSVDGSTQTGATTASFNLATASLAPGPHSVTAAIRDNTPFVRFDPTNILTRSRTWTVNVQAPTPDLQWSYLAHVEPTVAAGSTVTVFGQVDNIGTGPAGNFLVDILLSADAVIDPAVDYYLGGTVVNGLANGASSPILLQLQTPFHLGAGPWFLGAVIDRVNFVAELNETNNTTLDPATLPLTAPVGCPVALEFDLPLSFLGQYARVSNAAGGTRTLRITAPCNAGQLYLIGVSGTGTSPGTVLGPNLVLPLVYDSVTQIALGYVNSVPLLAFGGALDASGRAAASFAPPPGFFGGSGFKLYFAAAIFTQAGGVTTFTAATNATQIAIDP